MAAPEGRTATLDGPAAGARLEPGASVELTWTLPSPDADAGAGSPAEMELILSLDGGRTYPLRVTRRLDPEATGWRWDVPFLPTDHARLALRMGSDEAPEAERIALVSVEFAIAARPRQPAPEIYLVRGESRTREALDAVVAPPLRGVSLRTESEREFLADSLNDRRRESDGGADPGAHEVSEPTAGGALRRTAVLRPPRIAAGPLPLRL